MAAKNVTIKRLQQRNDTAATWHSKNPVLAKGEIGIETDTLKIKVGNGETAWNSLAYANAQDLSAYLLASEADSTYVKKADFDTFKGNAIVEMAVTNNTLTWTKGNGTTGSFDLGNIKWGA